MVLLAQLFLFLKHSWLHLSLLFSRRYPSFAATVRARQPEGHCLNCHGRNRETCSWINEKDIVGREDDKKVVIEMLLYPKVEGDISFVTIVGTGGVGKTTLTQSVFNDKVIQSVFSLRMWVCVSDQHPKRLDIKALLCKILESATKQKPMSSELETVPQQLRKAMASIAADANALWMRDVGGILHERSVITADQVKIFRDLDEDNADFHKKLDSWRPNLSEFLQPQSPQKPATQDLSPNDNCKKSYERSSKKKEIIYPEYKSLASKLDLSADFMDKYEEFSYAVPALNFYNQKNGKNFKLLDTSDAKMFYFGGMWAHIVFQAALPDSPHANNFFAEVLFHEDELKYEVKTVTALSDIKCYKCSMCDGLNIPHPRDFVSAAYSRP